MTEYQPSLIPVTAMDQIPKTTPIMPAITVYGPHECPNCAKAMELLARKGIPATKIDLTPGDENHRFVTSLGYTVAPVVVVELDDGTALHWGGHRFDLLLTLVRLCAAIPTV